MRPAYVFLLSLTAASVSVAAPPSSAPHPSAAAPVEALKKSLNKDTPKPDGKKPAKASPVTWMDLPLEGRESILREWLALPETTRPPFPVFRDTAIGRFASGGKNAAAADDAKAETPDGDDTPRDDGATAE